MELLYAIAELRTPFWDAFFEAFTFLGYQTAVVVVICALYWALDKDLATRVGLGFFFSGLLVQGLKITFRVPRPWVIDPEFLPVGDSMEEATGYSFPSGHTQAGTSLWLPLGLAAQKWILRVLFVLITLGVAFSRLYLGVHTPLDVGVALLLSGGITLGVHFLWDKLRDRRGLICGIMLAFALLIMVYALVLWKTGVITEEYADGACKAASVGMGFALGLFLEKRVDFKVEGLWFVRVIRVLAGLCGVLAIQNLPKIIFGDLLWVTIFRYFLLAMWVSYFYPIIFAKCEGYIGKKTK
ncbi:MAG: phosphatase PAP2 family protein [Clostridia bacterium]|nr:phosphatase PAP2 family protein [Clostridia bacterium]